MACYNPKSFLDAFYFANVFCAVAAECRLQPVVLGQLLAAGARGGACCGWFGVAHLVELPPPHATGKGPPPEALVLLFPWARAGAVLNSRHPHRENVPKVSGVCTGRTPFTLTLRDCSLWRVILTLRWSWNLWGDKKVAAAAAELLFCSSDSCGRNNSHPCCLPKQGRERLQRDLLPFNSRIFSKTSKCSTNTRTRISELHQTLPKQSDSLDDDGFTDLGVNPEVFTKEKIPILVNWIFCLNKILKIEPKGR